MLISSLADEIGDGVYVFAAVYGKGAVCANAIVGEVGLQMVILRWVVAVFRLLEVLTALHLLTLVLTAPPHRFVQLIVSLLHHRSDRMLSVLEIIQSMSGRSPGMVNYPSSHHLSGSR